MPVGNWWAGVVTTTRTPDAYSGPGGEALVVQGEGRRTEARRGVQVMMLRAAGVLHTGGAHPARVEHTRQQRGGLRHPGDHHDPLGVRHTRPGAARAARPGRSAARAAPAGPDSPGSRAADRPARSAAPRPTPNGEERQVGRPRHEVRQVAGGSAGEITRA